MFKPFIKLINNIESQYIYDINTNEIIEISKKIYNALKESEVDGADNQHFDIETQRELDNLISKGYLKSSRPQVIENTSSIFISSYLSNYISSIVLQTTQSCNFKCRYCEYASDIEFERNAESINMTWENSRKSIDFLLKHCRYSPDLNIGFYGGEPLLNFDVIKKTVEYISNNVIGKRVTYNITTNGSILNQEILDLFNEIDINILYSIDGPAKIHNKNRRLAYNGSKTHEKVYQNLCCLKKHLVNFSDKVSINAVIDPEENFDEYIDFFENDSLFDGLLINYDIMDTSHLDFSPNYNDEFYIKKSIYDIKQYLYHLEKPNSNLNVSREINKIKVLFQTKNGFNEKFHHNGPCIPGYHKLFVDVNGDLFPCEKVSEKSTCMKIGDIYSGFNYNKIYKFMNIGKLTEEKCKDCVAIRTCNICPREIDNILDYDVELKNKLCLRELAALNLNIEKYILFSKCRLLDK